MKNGPNIDKVQIKKPNKHNAELQRTTPRAKVSCRYKDKTEILGKDTTWLVEASAGSCFNNLFVFKKLYFYGYL